MISIAGLGIAGSYLLRRLVNAGFETSGYDPKRPDFRVPCGYATNWNRIKQYISSAGLEPSDYLEMSAREIILTGENGKEFHLGSTGLCTIEKNRLESDLTDGLPTRRSTIPKQPSDAILVDATGISRAYLGRPVEDFVMHTKEYLTDHAEHVDFFFRYFSGGHGYYWEFPLRGGYHVGAGSDSIDLINGSLQHHVPLRIMSRNIRLRPLLDEACRGNTIGIGEAIGTVSPLTGEGILPSLESAEILLECLSRYSDPDDLRENYARRIRRSFGHYEQLFRLLLASRSGTLLRARNITAIGNVRRDFRGFGIDLKIASLIGQLLK